MIHLLRGSGTAFCKRYSCSAYGDFVLLPRFCSLCQMLNSFAAAMWALRFDNSGWHFPGCGCVINLTKFTSRLFSAWDIGHRFHLTVSLLFSLPVQHPVPYNTWQLKEIHYSEEVSDVESAPRTVPKTSCEPEQPSRGETEHRAHTVIKSGDKTHGNHIKKPLWKQPNHQHSSGGALQLRAAAAWTVHWKARQTLIHTETIPIAITMVYSPPVFVMSYQGFH